MGIDAGKIDKLAKELGFIKSSLIAPEPVVPHFKNYYEGYLKKGYQATLSYLKRGSLRFEPQMVYPELKTMGVFSYPYLRPSVERGLEKHIFRITRLAWGIDYHLIVREKLKNLLEEIGLEGRVVCDTTPLPERYYGYAAGIGFIGKNGMLIDPESGSWFILGFILFKDRIESPPYKQDPETYLAHMDKMCGNCQICINACPGAAIRKEGVVDSNRCFSYWSIENRKGEIPSFFKREGWVYGCDSCQEGCPYNTTPLYSTDPEFDPSLFSLKLADGEISEITDARMKKNGVPYYRTGKNALLRNIEWLQK